MIIPSSLKARLLSKDPVVKELLSHTFTERLMLPKALSAPRKAARWPKQRLSMLTKQSSWIKEPGDITIDNIG